MTRYIEYTLAILKRVESIVCKIISTEMTDLWKKKKKVTSRTKPDIFYQFRSVSPQT